jgi:branched-chain amino acid aminotransferase
MLEVEWNNVSGWGKPRIVPYHNLSLDPACSVLHYAVECYEGMKAYLSTNGNDLLLFRPEMNAKRLNNSAKRLMLPVCVVWSGKLIC